MYDANKQVNKVYYINCKSIINPSFTSFIKTCSLSTGVHWTIDIILKKYIDRLPITFFEQQNTF